MCGSNITDPLGVTKTKIGGPLGLTKTWVGDPLKILPQDQKKNKPVESPTPATPPSTGIQV